MTEPSLFQQALGPAFDRLPPLLRHFHSLRGFHRFSGAVRVVPPTGLLARWLARALGTPLAAGTGAITFERRSQPGQEHWVRHFPGRTMASTLGLFRGQVAERLGVAHAGFRLVASHDKLEMQLAWLRVMGLPCPGWLLPCIVAEETATPGRLHFLVRATLPLVGSITHYQGYLEIPQGEPT